jgi:hypothetical protein
MHSGRAVLFQFQARALNAHVAALSGIKEAPFRQPKLQAQIWGKLSDKCGDDDAGGIAVRISAHLSQRSTVSRESGRDAVLALGCRSRSQSPFSLATKPERHAILTQASFSLR